MADSKDNKGNKGRGVPVVFGQGMYWVGGKSYKTVAEVKKARNWSDLDKVSAWCAAARKRATAGKG